MSTEKIKGTNVASPIVPFTTADQYPTHYAEFGKGGFRSVNEYTDLENIPEPRKEEGMLVYVVSDRHAYQLLNGQWVKSKIGGGIERVDNLESIPPEFVEEGAIVYSSEDQGYFYYLNEEWLPWDDQIHVGPTPPTNTSSLWIDTANHHYDENSDILYSIQRAVIALQEQVNVLMNIRTSGVICGEINDGERNELIDAAEPEKPEAKIIDEAESYSWESFKEGLDTISSATDILEVYNPLNSYLYLLEDQEEAQSLLESAIQESRNYSDSLNEVAPGFLAVLERCTLENGIIQPALDFAELIANPALDPGTTEIEPTKDIEPTVKHISIKMGTWDQLQGNILNFVPGELMWCTNRGKLYIYVNGSLVAISGSGGSSEDDDTMDELTVKSLINDKLSSVESIGFIPVGSDTALYTAKVNSEGRLIVYKKELDKANEAPKNNYYYENSVSKTGLLINSFYLGGINNDEHSYQPCSHNFVELSNVDCTKAGEMKDVNLEGFYLFYKGKGTGGWEKLKLWGKVPAGGTFLIRGAQCSVMDTNTTKIRVKTYDMEWRKSNGELIKFDQESSVFYLAWGDNNGKVYSGGFANGTSNIELTSDDLPSAGRDNLIYVDGGVCTKGYIDLVSYNDNEIKEKTQYSLPSGISPKDVIFRRWYPLDPVTQSNPKDGIEKHNNKKYFTATYLSGGNIDSELPIEEFTPRASYEGKTIATTRTLFAEDHPSTLTCSFGIQATDNSENTGNDLPPAGNGATRCFCWNSVGYYDEFLTYKKIKDSSGEDVSDDWHDVESIREDGNYESDTQNFLPYYKRNRWESAYGQSLTTHRVILRGLKAGKYCYKVTRKGDPTYNSGEDKIRTFTVRSDASVTSFNFVQTTDQQGANWEEYEVWNLSAKVIKRENEIRNTSNTYTNSSLLSFLKIYISNLSSISYNSSEKEYTLTYSETDPDTNEDVLSDVVMSSDDFSIYLRDYISDLSHIEVDTSAQDDYRFTITISGRTVPDFDFIINTGDICYNGSRSNEWIDYFTGYKPLSDREEMLTIGNNDLAPISMMDIGTGGESPWKINPYVIDYFYTFEIDPNNPQIFIGKKWDNPKVPSPEYKMPSLYSFNYGRFHFISLLSEMRTISNKTKFSGNDENGTPSTIEKSTVNSIFGVRDELREVSGSTTKVLTASKIYDTEEEWVIKDLIKWKNGGTLPTRENENENYWTEYITPYNQSAPDQDIDLGWKHREKERFASEIVGKCRNCIIFTHEMPFNIISDASYKNYDEGINAPRESAKAYLNRYHNYEYQRLFKLWGIPMVIGGHKHTCAITEPVYDAPSGYNPISKNIESSVKSEEDKILTDSGPIFNYRASLNPFMQIPVESFNSYWSKTNIKNYCGEIYNNSTTRLTLTTKYGDKSLSLDPKKSTTDLLKSGENSRIRIEVVDSVNAPSYVMCQATGFKNKSNSDLASGTEGGPIPWERFYVPSNNIAGQSYPFYTVYEINSERGTITAKMYRIRGMYEEPQDSGSKAGYWDLVKYYSPDKTLEENRQRILEKCNVEMYNRIGSSNNPNPQGTTGTIISCN